MKRHLTNSALAPKTLYSLKWIVTSEVGGIWLFYYQFELFYIITIYRWKIDY